MGIFYRPSPKRLFEIRNEIILKKCVPSLEKNGFQKSPYKGRRFGKVDGRINAYDFCRLEANSRLNIVTMYVSRGDRSIQAFLNIFELNPPLKSLDRLEGLDEVQFYIPPNNLTKMGLRINDIKGIPLFSIVGYKINSFYSESGFKRRVNKLAKLIENDLENIDSFVKRWYELHQPMVTDWEGHKIDEGK